MRKKYRHPLKTTLVLTAGLLALSSISWGNPIGLGTTSLGFDNNGLTFGNPGDFGTLTGNFVFDTVTGKLSSWDLQTTAGPFGGTAETYLNTDAGASGSAINLNGNEVLDFFDSFQQGGVTNVNEIQLVVACGGVQNCLNQASNGMSFNLVTGPCDPSQVCGFSGEQIGVPTEFAERQLSPGVLNVTDPPGTLAFNIATTATGPIFGSGGGNPGVPEPGTLSLIVPGLVALAGWKLRSKMTVRAL